MGTTTREWHLAKRPHGEPDRDTFDLRERDIPDPKPGSVLVGIRYLSVDPYMRGRMRESESYADSWAVGEPLQGGIVGEVVESRHERWDVGDLVTGNGNWADYCVLDGDDITGIDPTIADPPAYLGVLGMPGRTAYFGLLEVGEPRPGDTVVVSGAAGAVGSVVGQIANMSGCRVIGFAGTDEKIDWMTNELGFDAGINYKSTNDYTEALEEVAPEGVDVYFDNVGGSITDAVFSKLNLDARVAICGQIAFYNDEDVPTGPRKLPLLISTRARVQGLLVGDYAARFDEASNQLSKWVDTGQLSHRETIVEGLENAPDAFLGLFSGENIGKQVVRVSTTST